jgi:type I restriction enzyme S subunit
MPEFSRIRVGELVATDEAELKTGPFGTQLKASDYTEHGTPVINVRNIGFGEIRPDKLEFISPTTRDRLSSHVLRTGDIVFGRKGAVERHVFIRIEQNGWFQGSDCLRLRFASQRVEPQFASYFFLTAEHQRWMMNQCSHGATMASLNQEILERIELPLPPLPVQRRIAGILSAYDELIENSQRRIKILESMARALYREWFVHFRFPGHESVPRVPSSLGEIPKGWEVKTIAELCESVTYGFTASASREEVGPRFLRITDIVPATIDWAGVPFCEIPENKTPRYLLNHGDIVVARTGATTGYAKRLNKLHPDTVFASYLVRVRAKPGISNRMLGIVMESDEYKQYIQTNIGGAAQPQANAVVLTSMRLAVSPSSIGEEFDRLVAPLIDEAELLAVRIQNLRRTRDLLLPRLLSGQIDAEAIGS